MEYAIIEGRKSAQLGPKRIFHMTKFFASLLIIAIFMMAATAQTFTPNEKGEVDAITPEVRSLMQQVDKVITETAGDRLRADQKLKDALVKLRGVVENESSTFRMIAFAKFDALKATSGTFSARNALQTPTQKATLAYSDNVIAIAKAGFKLAPSNYREWQDKVLAITKESLAPIQSEDYKNLMERAEKAKESALKKDEEDFRWLKEFIKNQEQPRNKI